MGARLDSGYSSMKVIFCQGAKARIFYTEGTKRAVVEAKRDSSLRRPTASQERSRKKKRRPALFGMTVGRAEGLVGR